MSARLHIIFLGLVAFVTLFLSCYGMQLFYGPGSVFAPQTSGTWFTLVHSVHNSIACWRIDPYSFPLFSTFVLDMDSTWILLAQSLVWCWLGIILLVRATSKNSPLTQDVLFTTLVCSTLGVIASGDVPASQFFAWVPLLAYFIYRSVSAHSNRVAFSIVTIFLFFRVCTTSLMFCLPAVLLSCSLVAGLLCSNQEQTRRLRLWGVFLSIFAMVFSLGLPVIDLPDYPVFARVIDGDGVPGLIRSFFGPDRPIEILDSSAARLDSVYALFLFLLNLMLALILSRRHERTPGIVWGILCLTAASSFDVLSPPSLQSIGPLAALRRILPGMIYYSPALPAVIAASIALSLCFKQFLGARAALRCCCAMLICALGVRIYNSGSRSMDQYHEIKKFLALDAEKTVSPSLPVLLRMGLSQFIHLAQAPQGDPDETPIPDETSFQTNPPSKRRAHRRMLDGKYGTRWSSRSAGQTGTEWLAIRFPEPLVLDGVKLSPGGFATDFPRGLKVSVKDRCDEFQPGQSPLRPELEFDDTYWRPVFNNRAWRGPLLFTTKGFPYYGPQSDVSIRFDKSYSVQCILVEQTAVSPGFDWSVAEIRGLLWENSARQQS